MDLDGFSARDFAPVPATRTALVDRIAKCTQGWLSRAGIDLWLALGRACRVGSPQVAGECSVSGRVLGAATGDGLDRRCMGSGRPCDAAELVARSSARSPEFRSVAGG